MFNEDLEVTSPKEWVAFREKIITADGLLFLTPEYDRSVPGVLKMQLMSVRALMVRIPGPENPVQ